MAHSGPPGKGVKHGRTPNADWSDVPDQPYQGPSPDLPDLGRRRKWPQPVVQWWETLRRMPHCVLWSDSDWQFAVETAYLRLAFWTEFGEGEVRATMATELRRRDDQLGTTHEARRKLRIRYLDPAEFGVEGAAEDPSDSQVDRATVTDLSSRRQRLTA